MALTYYSKVLCKVPPPAKPTPPPNDINTLPFLQSMPWRTTSILSNPALVYLDYNDHDSGRLLQPAWCWKIGDRFLILRQVRGWLFYLPKVLPIALKSYDIYTRCHCYQTTYTKRMQPTTLKSTASATATASKIDMLISSYYLFYSIVYRTKALCATKRTILLTCPINASRPTELHHKIYAPLVMITAHMEHRISRQSPQIVWLSCDRVHYPNAAWGSFLNFSLIRKRFGKEWWFQVSLCGCRHFLN